MGGRRTWTIRDVLDWTCGYLGRRGDEHARLSAEMLLSAALGLSRVEVYLNFDRPLTADELAVLHDAVERRGRGEPVQYVVGETAFRHIVVRCAPGVLIPRPETEVLVDQALAELDARREAGEGPARVLEVGFGTGCVALSIASERPGTLVTATDVAPEALELATRNRAALGLEDAVDLIGCDLVSGVPDELMGRFDVLVSNPPYVPTEVLDRQVPAEVADFEPRLALDGGPDGLDVFRRLLDAAPEALAPGGSLCVELYEGSLDRARELALERGGWREVEVVEDLTRRPRVLVARREVA